MDVERTRLRDTYLTGARIHAMRKAQILLVVMNDDGITAGFKSPGPPLPFADFSRDPPRGTREITNPGSAKLRRTAIARLIRRV